MKTGVSTAACGSVMTATRALLTGHSASILKAKALGLLLDIANEYAESAYFGPRVIRHCNLVVMVMFVEKGAH